MAKTVNFNVDELDDVTKNPLERPLKVNENSNKRSGKIDSKSSDKITKLEDSWAHDKIKHETADLYLSAIMVDNVSSNSATNSFEDKVDTDPAKDAEWRVSKEEDGCQAQNRG